MNAWFSLLIAGVFEVVWVIGMKYSEGFTKPVPSILTLISLILSLVLLSHALKTIPMGSAYAIWTGIGAVGVVMLGILIFDEDVSFGKSICIIMIVFGIMGLKLLSSETDL
jgi:quaternary ammonium compound-resistance protein SugE